MAEQRVKMGKAKLGKFTGALCGAAQRAAADGRVVAQRVAADGRVVAQRAAADGYGAAQRATADGKKYLNGVAKARQDRQAAGGTEGKEAADGLPEKEKQLKGHAIQERELSPGDHIYVYRVAIQHHGIVTHVPWAQQAGDKSAEPCASPQSPSGGVQVVHLSATSRGVESTSLENFLKGGLLHRATYEVSTVKRGLDIGASYGRTSDDPEGIVARASEAAKVSKDGSGQWDGYGLLTKNSETFAYWCCTGRQEKISRQAVRGLVGASIVVAGASVAASAACAASAASAGSAAAGSVAAGSAGASAGSVGGSAVASIAASATATDVAAASAACSSAMVSKFAF